VSELLYLDTARLGRMSLRAKQAHQAFADLAADEGGSIYLERFLRDGFTSIPDPIASRCRGLAGWQGIQELKRNMRKIADGRKEQPVLIANRSAQVMKLSARILFHPCRNVLTTDLDWPGYREILNTECRRANRTLTPIAIRSTLLRNNLSDTELVEYLRKQFFRNNCDGLFLTAVSNDGIRFPIRRLVQQLETTGSSLFTVVDGAQDFCHASSDFRSCDLYLTGVHKWLQAYQPLGIGFYGRVRSKERIEFILDQMLASGDLDDPLLRWTSTLASQCRVQETFNLAPLFTAQGAIEDATSVDESSVKFLDERLGNRETASQLAQRTDWQPISPDPSLRTGILMLRPENPAIARQQPDTLREAFRDRGISLSTYPEGLLRLSMPATPFTGNELMQLSDGLRSVNKLFG
jgi:selenocysteine lyase/cysteine desulfurase